MTRRSGKKDGENATLRGYAMPDVREAVARAAGAPLAPSEPPAAPASPRRPAIDVELVVERKTAPYVDRPWVALEVWTQNRIYSLDGGMVCLEVLDKHSGQPEPAHPLLGARLVGGQHETEGAMELSHPFPRVGSEAVFEQGSGRNAAFSHTSEVQRVVLRLRVLTVTQDRVVSSWQDLTGSLRAPVVPSD